jgi:hypothetical protein
MKRFSVTTMFLALVGAMSVNAATATVAYSDPASQGTQAFGGNLALNFSVNSPIDVTALGVFNASGTGVITGLIQVVIYDAAGSMVTPVDTFQGSYAPAASGFDVLQDLVVPVLLGPGSYQVDAVGFSGSDLNGNLNTGSSTGPVLNTGGGLLSFNGAGWDSKGTLDNPNSCLGCQALPAQYSQFDAGTFQYSGVPEPATFALFGSGFLGIAAILRRRRAR